MNNTDNEKVENHEKIPVLACIIALVSVSFYIKPSDNRNER